jgi:hypothetical protein
MREICNEAFWRTILADMDVDQNPLASGEIYSLAMVYVAVTNADRNPMFRLLAAQPTTRARFRDMVFRIGATTVGKRLCLTKKGYLAIVPPGTRQGDSVCLIWGATIPFVIHPHADGPQQPHKYVIVVGAYIQGIMKGEMTHHALQLKDLVFT